MNPSLLVSPPQQALPFGICTRFGRRIGQRWVDRPRTTHPFSSVISNLILCLWE